MGIDLEAYAKRTKRLHKICTLMEKLGVPYDDIARIVEDIQASAAAAKKKSFRMTIVQRSPFGVRFREDLWSAALHKTFDVKKPDGTKTTGRVLEANVHEAGDLLELVLEIEE